MKVSKGVVAIITARAGSKGLPGKNKAIIGGLPLIEYTVRALEAARSLRGILLTTDDKDILDHYRTRNSIFLVERPAPLARDGSKSAEAVAHALKSRTGAVAGRIGPEALLIAQPTTPLRTASDIEAALELFRSRRAHSLVSVCRVEGNRHPREMYRTDGELQGHLFIPDVPTRRQNYEILFHRNGAIYIVTTEYFRRTGCLVQSDPPSV